MQDLKHAIRTCRAAPTFSVVVIATFALGIGGTTAIFSVVDAVLLRPLPYRAGDELVQLLDLQAGNREISALSLQEYLDWRERSGDVFADVGAWSESGEVLDGSAGAEQLQAGRVSANLPALLGVRPLLGRTFRTTEESPSADGVVMLSEGLWRSHFAGDPNVIGRSISLTGASFVVIGVFPSTPESILPSAYRIVRGVPADLWLPLRFDARSSPPGLHHLSGVARLRQGQTAGRVASRLEAIAAAIRKDRGTTHSLRVKRLDAALAGNIRSSMLLIVGAVLLLLVIACANAANLLIARSIDRRRELAVRQALGAGRRAIASLVLIESGLLAALGGVCGVGLAYAMVGLGRAALVGVIPRIAEVAIDGRVLAASAVVALGSGVLVGFVPAFGAFRRDVARDIGSASRGAVEASAGSRVRRFLVIAEVGLSFTLLATAALLAASYQRLVSAPTGFEASGLVSGRVWLPSTRYPERSTAQRGFFDRLRDRLGAEFGGEWVAFASNLPIAGGTTGTVVFDGGQFPDGAQHIEKRIVSWNYFKVVKARLVRGRFFDETDREGAMPVVVINQTFANQWFAGENAVGRRVGFAWGIDGFQTIAGVVADVREGPLDAPAHPAIYISMAERPSSDMYIIVRTALSTADAASRLRAGIAGLDPGLPLIEVRRLPDVVAATVRPRALTAVVESTFAIVALLLASVGLYGVISHAVSQRGVELGIRAALGAAPIDLMRLVLGQTAGLMAVGMAIGAAMTLGVGSLLNTQLFGITATEPRVYLLVTLLLAFVATIAGAVPALRAMRVRPVDALRS